MKTKKGQVAMEYIITYGWALIAVMVLVAGLSFFGIFRPEDTLPEECYISTDIQCEDYRIYVVEDGAIDREYVELYVRNTNREDFFVSKVQCKIGAEHNMTDLSDAFQNLSGSSGYLPTNRYIRIICGGQAVNEEIVRDNAKGKAEIYLDIFTDSSFPHQIKGEVVSKVKKTG